MPFEAVKDELAAIWPEAANEPFWLAVRENCQTIEDARAFADIAYGRIEPVIDDEDAGFISEAHALLPEGEISTGTWSAWTAALKEKTGRKGRGLFMPLRKALTGQQHGPDMSAVLPLLQVIKARG